MKRISLFVFSILILFSFNIKVKALSGYADVDDVLYLRSTTDIYTSTILANIPPKGEITGMIKTSKTGGGCTTNWYYGTYNGKSGYVCGAYVKITNNTTETGKVSCVENDDPLNIWSDINKSSRLKQVSCDKELNILQKNYASNSKCAKWYMVEYGGTIGYACGTYIYQDSTTTNGSTTSGTTTGSSNDSGSSTGSSGGSTNANIGKTTTGDNIYEKKNYASNVNGDGFISCYEDTGDLTLRSTPGGSSTGNKVSCGVSVKVNDIRESSGTCGYYYNVTNMETDKSGWVCGYFVNTTKLSSTAMKYYNSTESLDSYYATLRQKKFPESYLPYLAEIHARHPNWKFDAEIINLDFDTVVSNEAYNGRNLLQGSAFDENYRSMGLDTYSILNDEFDDYDTEEGWYNPSSEAIAFYLDPRNYLNEKYIFAFESLYYNNSHNVSMVSKILSGQTFWPTVYTNFSSNVSDDLMTATRDIGISSVHIASRIKQEITGISTSDPRLGGSFVYNGTTYSGYYNFFNIKVYGSNKIVNGMVYAMNNGWNTPYNGLYGGSNFIYNDYVGVNQDTMYYEKFDVSTTDGHYTHQYMQNLAAAVQETDTSFKSYVGLGDYLDKEMTFTIPVYNNMSNYAVTSPRVGNPNNYLKDLKIDGKTINGFSYDEYEYDITLPALTNSINISASVINSNASVSGVGNVLVDSNEKVIKVVVKAQNMRERTYTLNITRTEAKEEDIISLTTTMNSSGVKYNTSYIFGISENTDSKSFIDNIKKISNLNTVSIKDKNGNAKSGIFKTGDVVTVSNTKDTKSYTVVIYGDINGDGIIDKLDYLAVLRDYYGYSKLTGVYKDAADTNHDGKVDKLDYLAVLRDYYGYAKISQ